jgi:hypothetical protein
VPPPNLFGGVGTVSLPNNLSYDSFIFARDRLRLYPFVILSEAKNLVFFCPVFQNTKFLHF